MMHRNSQWEEEVIDLENQITELLNKLESAKMFWADRKYSIPGTVYDAFLKTLEIES